MGDPIAYQKILGRTLLTKTRCSVQSLEHAANTLCMGTEQFPRKN